MKTNRLKSYLLKTLLIIALCAAYCLFGGLLSTLTGLLISALLGTIFYREHYGLGAANAILILCIFTLFSGVVPALTSGVPLILLALSLAMGARHKLSIYHLLLLCSFLYMADLMVGMETMKSLTGGEVTFTRMMLEMGTELREAMSSQYPSPDMAVAVEKAVAMAVDMFIMLAPAIFMIISTILAFILILVFKKIQQGQEVDMSFLLPFDHLQGDRLVAVLYLVLFLLQTGMPEGMFADLTTNVLLVLNFLFVCLGISVFNYQMKQKGLQKKTRRLLMVLLLCFSVTFFVVPIFALLIYGLTDCFWDYRHLRAQKKEQ